MQQCRAGEVNIDLMPPGVYKVQLFVLFFIIWVAYVRRLQSLLRLNVLLLTMKLSFKMSFLKDTCLKQNDKWKIGQDCIFFPYFQLFRLVFCEYIYVRKFISCLAARIRVTVPSSMVCELFTPMPPFCHGLKVKAQIITLTRQLIP